MKRRRRACDRAAAFRLHVLYGTYIVHIGSIGEDAAMRHASRRHRDGTNDAVQRPCRTRRYHRMHVIIAFDAFATTALLYFSCSLQESHTRIGHYDSARLM